MVPATIDVCEKYLYADTDEMTAAGLPDIIQQRLMRIRSMHAFWLQFPRKSDGEIVDKLMREHKVSRSTAYEDVRIIKTLLGNMSKASKDYHRFRFIAMIEETFATAKRIGDARAMAAAAAHYGKYTQLDKEEAIDKGYDKIVVQPFIPTDDPTVLGIKPVPNIRERIAAKLKQYWSEDIEDVQFEEADYNEDDVFGLKPETE